MRRFATYSELVEHGRTKVAKSLLKEASDLSGKSVFLSHSSADDELVPGVIQLLKDHGASVYADVIDPKLPGYDIDTIASRLREAARGCQRFVLLVSPRTSKSKWIPWELGLGDGKNGFRNVALFPVAEYELDQQWSEQEYLGLYRRIIWGNIKDHEPEWIVLNHKENKATRLEKWL